MKKLLLKLISLIICAGILAGGAYLSYTQSDFDKVKSDWDKIFSSPLFSELNNGDEVENPDNNPEGDDPASPDETPEGEDPADPNGTPEGEEPTNPGENPEGEEPTNPEDNPSDEGSNQ